MPRLISITQLRSAAPAIVHAGLHWAKAKTAQALWASSKNPNLRLAKAQSEAAYGDPHAAERDFRFVIARQPDNTVARLGLANTLAGLSQHSAALAEIDVVLRADASNLQARLMQGQIQAAMKRYDDAIETVRSVLLTHPSNDTAIDTLTQLYFHTNRMEELISLLRSVIDKGYGTEKRSRYLADAIVAAAVNDKKIALAPVSTEDIEQPPDASAEQSAAAIRQNTYIVARELYDEAAKAFFWKLAEDHFVTATHQQPLYMRSLHHCRKTGETKESWLYQTDVALFRHALNARVIAIANAYFRDVVDEPKFVMPYHAINCRYLQPTANKTDPTSLLPFHQDGIGFPRTYQVLNFWTLLYPEECGRTSPGLDLVAAAPDVFLPVGKAVPEEDYGHLKTNAAFMDDVVRQFPPITPSVKQGDAVVFNELALHRTSVAGGLSRARASAEIRLVAATRVVMEELDNGNILYALIFLKNGTWYIRWVSEWAQLKSGDSVWLAPGFSRPIKFRQEPLWPTQDAAMEAR